MVASLRGSEPGRKQHDREHWSVCDSDLLRYSYELYKSPIHPVTNPNPVYSHSRA
jgi:hypothetical protein